MQFLPAAGQGADQLRQVRGAVAGTFVACLELTRQGEVRAEQEAIFEPVRIRSAPTGLELETEVTLT